VGSIETFKHDEKTLETLYEEHDLYETLETSLVPQVRYVYSDEDDLVAVHGKEDLLLRTFTYTNHVMTSHTVPEGLESFYVYDDYSFEGKVLKNTTNTGQSWDFDYQEGQTIVTDALGRETVYKFDKDKYFTNKLNPLHQESQLLYTPNGLLKEIVDPTGKSQSFNYDDAGLMKENRVGMLGSTKYRYHRKHHKPIMVEDDKGKTLFAYDPKANLIEERHPNKETVTYQRDIYGNPTQIDNSEGTTLLEYNASSSLTKHTNVEGEVTRLEYDERENLVKLTNIYADVTQYKYNTQDKLTEVLHADGSTESYTYSTLGSLLSHTDIFNTTTYYSSDKEDRLVEIQNPKGSTHFEYDVEGRLQVQVDPLGKQSKYSYDALDRVTSSKSNAGEEMYYAYEDTYNTLSSITDPTNNTSTYTVNIAGDISTEHSPYLGDVHYLYEPQDNQLVQKQYKDGSLVSYSYTHPTNLLNIVSTEGMTQAFVYDKWQRLAKAESSSKPLGKELNTDAIHTVELNYHNTGELKTQILHNIEVKEEKNSKKHAKTLHFLDQALTVTQKTKKCQTLVGLNNSMPIVLSYNTKARTQTISYPNNTKELYTFNESKELIQLETANKDFAYQRDALGRIVQKTNHTDHTSIDYIYDAQDRLTQAGQTHFTYAPQGHFRRLCSGHKAGNPQNRNKVYNTNKNQLKEDATYTYTYDGRGNLKGKVNKVTKEYTLYTFNGLNQLTAVYTANKKNKITHYLRYEYDALNRRVSKEENTVKNYYLYDKQNIIAILNKDKQHLATIVHHPTLVDTPLSISNINGTFYYHRDHQGSIIALTDEQGEVVESIEYDGHYGKVLKHTRKEPNYTLNPSGYTGREMDADDLYYYSARYYDPNMQRFLSLDPIGFEAGDFNFYRYAGGDPVNFRDPSGLIGKGVLSDLADAIGETKDSTDKFKDIMKDSEKSKKCENESEYVCEIENVLDKLNVMKDRSKKGAKEEIKSFIPEPLRIGLDAVGALDSPESTPVKVPDVNSTTPTVSTDGNLTQSVGKENVSECSWIVPANNPTNASTAVSCN
jgi:RHS repeat-associated protein